MCEYKRFEFSERTLLGMNLDNPGGCIYCGAYTDGVEPDAHDEFCHGCGKRGVCGAQELLLMGLVDISEDEMGERGDLTDDEYDGSAFDDDFDYDYDD